MFLDFFLLLRRHALPVTLPEYLTLLAALRSQAGEPGIDDFYYLSKTTLIKHEQHLDLFDRLFNDYITSRPSVDTALLPDTLPDWLRDALDKQLSDQDRAALSAEGGIETLWQQLRDLLEAQDQPRPGNSGNGDAGSGQPIFPGQGSAEGEGPNLDSGDQQRSAGNRTTTRIWEQRAYQNLDDQLELNTRNLKMALRRLRILTREGSADELDIDATIDSTSRNAGLLDIRMQPSRQNRVKVLMLFDVGGSMDEHIDRCSRLFSAARYQFRHLEFLYFHNCVYETLWKDNHRRRDRVPTWEVLHKYNKDYKVIFVGDAAMSPHEITVPKGSVEHYNEEAGLVWLNRFRAQYPHLVWLNPNLAAYWQYTHSTAIIREWSGNRMFPLTLSGLEQAMKCLKNPKLVFNP